MPLLAVRALYDGEHIHLLEDAPVSGSYRVLVTFVAPANAEELEADLGESNSLWDTFGAWQDERSAEEIAHEIREARRSKTTPPALASICWTLTPVSSGYAAMFHYCIMSRRYIHQR